eukprot:360178-Ditylum_brightwellii.AAC.1
MAEVFEFKMEKRHSSGSEFCAMETPAITMMTATETMFMKHEILPQSLVIIVVNAHKADNKNNEAGDKNKDNADAVD